MTNNKIISNTVLFYLILILNVGLILLIGILLPLGLYSLFNPLQFGYLFLGITFICIIPLGKLLAKLNYFIIKKYKY